MAFNNNNGEQLRRKYRIFMQKAEQLANVDSKLANSYFNEAAKIMNQINLIRRQNPSYL